MGKLESKNHPIHFLEVQMIKSEKEYTIRLGDHMVRLLVVQRHN